VAVALVSLALVAAGTARAQRIEAVNIEVEGMVSAAVGAPPPSRDALLRAALLEAVVEVARRMLAPATFEAQQQAIRAALEPKASGFVLTFRPGQMHQRESPLQDDVLEFFQPVAATVDARRVRAFLGPAGWPPLDATRPSLVLCVLPAAGFDSAEGEAALERLRRFVANELELREFILIEPGVREGAPACDLGALGLARELGADLGIELRVQGRAQPGGRAPGSAIAEVEISARRTGDAGELALGRFQGVGHHDAPAEAMARALEAAQVQVVDNLVLQLTRNWQEIAAAAGPVELVLVGVTGLSQVLSVKELVEARLGADQAELFELGPGTASLRVDASLSPGALQDRLAAARFDGFSLEPVEATAGRVELRVREAPDEPDQIDTQEPN
jgi:hypothetical protein